MALHEDSPAPENRKLIRIDNRTHRITLLEGDHRLFGRPLEQDLSVGPHEILEFLHPEDVEKMLDAFEKGIDLQAGEEMFLQLRVKHMEGFWMLVQMRIRPETRNVTGTVLTTVAEIVSVPLKDGSSCCATTKSETTS